LEQTAINLEADLQIAVKWCLEHQLLINAEKTKLQSVQNFGCRVISGVGKFDHITPALRELNWLPVEKLLLERETVMVYKCLNGLAHDYIVETFIKRSDIHDRSTRNHDLLDIPLYRTAAGQRTFNYRGAKIWNDLDDKLKNITSIIIFKKELREILLKESY
jgi:hypothetical protein